MDEDPYTDDEIESAWHQADEYAIADHNTRDASAVHAMVGDRLWQALRDLGAAGGRMLVTGIDAHAFAQLPRDRVQVHQDGFGVLVADIPPEPASAFDNPIDRGNPDDHAEAREAPVALVDRLGSVYDVVIHNAHLADVTIHHPGLRDHLLQNHHVSLLTALIRTRPGGFFATLMPRDVLDDPSPSVREAITLLGDVLGTVRLPSGALRNVAGCDNPTDLILVRRRPDHEKPTDQATFLDVAHLLPPDDNPRDHEHEHLHRHYVEQPWRVLGEVDARLTPGGLPRLAIRPHDRPLADQLSQALRRIVRSAQARDLAARPGPRQAATPRPPREPPHRPHRPGPARGPEIDL